MDRLLFDYTLSPAEHEAFAEPIIRQREKLMYLSAIPALAVAILLAVASPPTDLSKQFLSMLVVAAAVILPAVFAYRQMRAFARKPLRIRADSSFIHVGPNSFSYLSVLQSQVTAHQGRQTLRLRTLRQTHQLHLPGGPEGDRVLHEIQSRLPRYRFMPKPV